MEILIKTSFDSVEAAEACVKRIRESGSNLSEIRLIPPEGLRHHGENATGVLPAVNAIYPGTLGNVTGAFALGPVDPEGRDNRMEKDFVSGDAVVEIVANPVSESRIRSIIVNAGGRDTVVF